MTTVHDPAISSAVVDLPQASLAYRVAGPASGAPDSTRPPVVFVHGLLVDARLWDPVAARLAEQGVRSYAPTLPLGSHQSPLKPGTDLSPAGIAGLVLAFIEALGLRDVILVGNDTGGAICQLVLGGDTSRIGGAVLTNCDAFGAFPPLTLAPLFSLLRHPRLVAGLVPTFRSKAIRHGPLAYGPLARTLDPALTSEWVAPMSSPGIRHDVAAFTRQVHSRVLLDATSRFGQFEGPVRVLWGDGDLMFRVALGRRLSSAFPRGTFTTVPGGRTFLPLDHPGLVADEVIAAMPA